MKQLSNGEKLAYRYIKKVHENKPEAVEDL
jgi:hypothetical protein